MVVAASNEPDHDDTSWNAERENLAFLREEGLELLKLFQSIKDKKRRSVLVDLIRVIAGKDAER